MSASIHSLNRPLRWVASLCASLALSASAQTPAKDAPAAAEGAARKGPATIALLLPSQSSAYARVAEVVRQGVFAAQAASGTDTAVQVIELDEGPDTVAQALSRARERGASAVLGPLTRAHVDAAAKTRIALPIVMLNQPDLDVNMLPTLLAFGLPIEQEARALVAGALRQLVPAPAASAPARTTPRFVILTGESPLARRATLAFRTELQNAGERFTVIQFTARYEALVAVGERVAAAQPDAIFLALEAREAAMLRPRLPSGIPLLGTSLVNLGGAEGALLAPDLEGVTFVDCPWLLEPDHPAVMVYPPPAQPLSAELQRLYALGIDGYRLVTEWASGRTQFTLDGVTGWLQVDRARSARTERWPSFAVFRGGKIERIEVAR